MAFIKAVSYYLPERCETNDDLVRQFPEWSVDKVKSKIGIECRHLAADDETAGDMAEKAARKLFAEYNIDPEEIDFVLLCTQSPDYFLPSTACVLQHRLGIPTTAGAFDYNLGCSGFVYGLAVAKGLIASGIAGNVLLLTSETYQKYLHPEDKSNRSIFGDGAAATLVSTEGFARIGEFVLGTDGGGARKLILETGASRCKAAMNQETEDDNGSIRRSDYLYMDGSAIFNFTLDEVPVLIERLLAKNGLMQDNIDLFLLHQANKFMLNTIRQVCNLPKEKFYVNLIDTGNTVSATIPIALRQCLDSGVLHKDMTVLTAGFGVGLSLGGVVLYL